MRTKQEILKEIEPIRSGNLTMGIDLSQRIIIELLLDIRDSSPHSTGESEHSTYNNIKTEDMLPKTLTKEKWDEGIEVLRNGNFSPSPAITNLVPGMVHAVPPSPREEWDWEKEFDSRFMWFVNEPRNGESIKGFICSLLHSEKERMRVGVENMRPAQIAYSGGEYWIRKDDVLSLINNTDK